MGKRESLPTHSQPWRILCSLEHDEHCTAKAGADVHTHAQQCLYAVRSTAGSAAYGSPCSVPSSTAHLKAPLYGTREAKLRSLLLQARMGNGPPWNLRPMASRGGHRKRMG